MFVDNANREEVQLIGMDKPGHTFSVVIPVLDEQDNIAAVLDNVRAQLGPQHGRPS